MDLGFFNKYPYTDFHELNLDWLIAALKAYAKELQEFVQINAIKYADPLQWDITRQYEKNTVVIDPLTGTAYISVQPVPSGVSLARPEYWTVIFDLSVFITAANNNFTVRIETSTTTTATFNTSAGEWLIWDQKLYKANVNITAGDAYVEGGNITRWTVEESIQAHAALISALDAKVGDLANLTTTDKSSIVNAINDVVSALTTVVNNVGDLANLTTVDQSSIVNAINELVTSISGVVATIGDLANLTTTDKSSIVNAINELVTSLSTLSGNVGDLANLTTTDTSSIVNAINELVTELGTLSGSIGDLANLQTTDKSSLVNAINEVFNSGGGGGTIYVTPEQFGAVGDGVTDDTQAIQDALDSGADVVTFTQTYLVTPQNLSPYYPVLDVPSNIILNGTGTIQLDANSYSNYSILNIRGKQNVHINDLTIIGDLDTHTGLSGEWGFGINVDDSEDIFINNVKVSKCWGDGIFIAHLDDSQPVVINKNVHVVDSKVSYNRRNNVTISSVIGCYVTNCEINHAGGTAPEAGIDIEPDIVTGEQVENCFITNCYFHDNTARALEADNFSGNPVKTLVVTGCTFENEDLGFRGVSADDNESKPIITGCKFINVLRPIWSETMALLVTDNYFYSPSASTSNVPFNIGGTGAKISNNFFSVKTTIAHMMKIVSPHIELSGNKFYKCAANADLIDVDTSDCSILNNFFGDFDSSFTFLIVVENNNGTRIIGNVMNNVNAPNYVVGNTVATNSEVVAFNTGYCSTSFIYSGALNSHANMINGTYTA